MAFIKNPKQLAEALTEILDTPVSSIITSLLEPQEFRKVCAIMYQNGTEEQIMEILEVAKARLPKKHYRPATVAYLKMKSKPLDHFVNFERLGAQARGDNSLRQLIY